MNQPSLLKKGNFWENQDFPNKNKTKQKPSKQPFLIWENKEKAEISMESWSLIQKDVGSIAEASLRGAPDTVPNFLLSLADRLKHFWAVTRKCVGEESFSRETVMGMDSSCQDNSLADHWRPYKVYQWSSKEKGDRKSEMEGIQKYPLSNGKKAIVALKKFIKSKPFWMTTIKKLNQILSQSTWMISKDLQREYWHVSRGKVLHDTEIFRCIMWSDPLNSVGKILL